MNAYYLIEELLETGPETYQATLKDEGDNIVIAGMWKDNWRDLGEGKWVYGHIDKNHNLRPGHWPKGYADIKKELA